MPAFRYAAHILKSDLLELDCQLTKDGIPVIFHDNDLSRMCLIKNKTIRDYNYDELPSLVPSSLLPEHVQNLNESRRIPTLEELLKEFPTWPMQIDVKSGPEELVIKVGSLIKKYNREQFTVWGSFKWSVNRMCFKHFKTDIPMFYDIWSALFSFGCWSVGLWKVYSWWNPRHSCLIFPNIKFFARKGWFARLNELGIPILLFGTPGGSIHTMEGYHQARNLGVNGICTDKPSLLKEFLSKYPLRRV